MNGQSHGESQVHPSRPGGIETIIAALRASGGVVTLAAKKLNINRRTLNRYLVETPELWTIKEEIREEILDLAEAELIKLIREGHPRSVQFYLRTMGRERGYGDNLYVMGPGGRPIAVEADIKLSQTEFTEIAREIVKELL